MRRPVAAAIRTVDAAIADRLPGLAAEVAFWVLLSLPALLLAAIAGASVVIGDDDVVQDQLIDRLAEVASVALTQPTIDQGLVPIVRQLFDSATAGVISFAVLAALWTASRAVKTILTTISLVSGRDHIRKGWQDRLLGFGVTIGAFIIGSILAPLLIAGPNFGEPLADWLRDALNTEVDVVATIWAALYWPVVLVVATLALAALYQFGVPGRSRWRGAWPGAVLATGVWLLGSAGLRIYGALIADGNSVYGPLAGPIVALLWLWVTGFAVLLGAELNAQLARVWPALRDTPRRDGTRRTVTTAELLADDLQRAATPAASDSDTTRATAGPATLQAALDTATDTDADAGTDATQTAADRAMDPAADAAVTRPITDPAGPPAWGDRT